MDFEEALTIVLRWEGGYSNHPSDPGGATNLGITQHTLADWRGGPVTMEEVRALRIADVEPIYRARYWNECRCPDLPDGVDLLVFDCAVNQGPARAKRLLQRSVRVVEDGILGPVSMRAIQRRDTATLADELTAQRAAHYASLQSGFHLGWFRRLTDIHRHALAQT